jgi:hypothetical protein
MKEFTCGKLKITITDLNCIHKQKDALKFWGPEAEKMCSCPCDQGRKIMEGNMPNKKGTCTNCGRGPMNIANKEGYCHSCYEAVKEIDDREVKMTALFVAKERLTNPDYARVANHAKTKRIDTELVPEPVRQTKQDNVQKAPPHTDACPVIVIPIRTDADRKAKAFIDGQAHANRRTVEQQILWLIEAAYGSEAA